MRMQVDREAMILLRALGEEGRSVRRRIERLLKDPYPDDAREIADEPGVYEIFEAGYWIAYEVDKSDPGETVVIIWSIEAN